MDTLNYSDTLGLQCLNHPSLVLDQVIVREELESENKWLAANEDLCTLRLPTQHIDLALSAKSFGGNLRLAKQMLTTMLANFYTDFQVLQESYDQHHWILFSSLLQQLRAGVAYCGTPRLEAICLHLEQQLRKTPNTAITTNTKSVISPLYRQLLMEIKTIQYEVTEMEGSAFSAI